MANSFENKIIKIIQKFDKNDNSELVESIKKVAPQDRVKKLLEAGIITNLEGYEWGSSGGDRFFVFGNINGVPLPMYMTSARTDGKREDANFFPFFGIQTPKVGQRWLIKAPTGTSNVFYNSKDIEKVSKILTETFDFDTSRLKNVENNFSEKLKPIDSIMNKIGEQVDEYVPKGREITTDENLNNLLSRRFSIDYNEINNLPEGSSEAFHKSADKILKEIIN